MTRWLTALLATYVLTCAKEVPAQTTKLMLFGTGSPQTYLGCINCSEYASDSVHNQYGHHGSAYSADSIFNHYGPFGSPYSPSSPCNVFATDPPVIVDSSGAFYGRLTLNVYHPQANENDRLHGWLEGVCER